MTSIAATPVAGRAGGQASSSRLAHAAKALSSARSAAVSGVAMAVLVLLVVTGASGDAIAVLVVLLVTGASDQRRRLRSAAEDMFFRVLQPGC